MASHVPALLLVLLFGCVELVSGQVNDYDCNGDGIIDCKQWDYKSSKCERTTMCSYKYKFGDVTLSQSCRCDPKKPDVINKITAYDCDGDSNVDCKGWDTVKHECSNPSMCSFQYEFGDIGKGQSCRCKPAETKQTDYDCYGDGENECGKWNYKHAMCENRASVCAYQYKIGDLNLDQSCRCGRCAGAAEDTAVVDKTLIGEDQYHFYTRWRNWDGIQDTCTPWMMPEKDDDVRALLAYAKAHKYTVRVSGSTHSAGGLVTNGTNHKEIVISLGKYKAPSQDYEYKLDETGREPTVFVNAGWGLLELYSKIRPLGYFLPTQTAGPIFSIGGVISNTIHGGFTSESYVNAYVRKMRVMLHDGSIKIVSGDELKMWRNSYGLLGVVLSAEFALVKRPNLQLWTETHTMKEWSAKEFWDLLTLKGGLNISAADLPADATQGDRTASYSELFYDPVTLKSVVLIGKQGIHATHRNWPMGAPKDVQKAYDDRLAEKVLDQAMDNHNKITYGEAVRRWGAPSMAPLVGIQSDPLLLTPRALIELELSPLGVANQVKQNVDTVNDGFYVNYVPNTYFGAYFIPLDKLFDALTFLKKDYETRTSNNGFQWNGPCELRFVTVGGAGDGEEDTCVVESGGGASCGAGTVPAPGAAGATATLSPVEPGVYALVDVLSFPTRGAAISQGLNEAFMTVEKYWMDHCDAKPHMGKQFGFEKFGETTLQFEPSVVCKVYSPEKKAEFNRFRQQVDPDNLFFGGLGSTLLSACPE